METTDSQTIQYNKSVHKDHCDYYWNEYIDLAKQRLNYWEDIKRSLLSEAIDDFIFRKWFRAVKWRYSNHPLCTLGSLKDPGGRFNIGDINPLIPQFSGLYLAQDKETAESELFSCKKEHNLSPYELSLTKTNSVSVVSVQGTLDTVFDIRGHKKLTSIIKIIKKFKFSKAVKNQSKKTGIKYSTIIQTRKQLHTSISDIGWRRHPVLFDLPSNSQIFGQMVRASGISGILYKSYHTQKECLAIFPSNLQNSSSYIELMDEPPNNKIPKKIDKTNFGICEHEIQI